MLLCPPSLQLKLELDSIYDIKCGIFCPFMGQKENPLEKFCPPLSLYLQCRLQLAAGSRWAIVTGGPFLCASNGEIGRGHNQLLSPLTHKYNHENE